MRTSEAALALITRFHSSGQTEYLTQWNDAWQAYSLIGGHVEAGETFRQCCIREIEEELELHPALWRFSISNGLTPHVRRHMATASAMPGSYDEATKMMSDDGITVNVNKLREVCGGIGRKLVQMTSSGSVLVDGNPENRRTVVSKGLVRLLEPRRGLTKMGGERSLP